MKRSKIRICFPGVAASLLVLAACATTLPPSRSATGPRLEGEVLAVAGEGDLVVAAVPAGLYVRRGDGHFVPLPVPGIGDSKKVSALAVRGDEIAVGTKGEGLHILSGGTWEVRTARYGGLPDDEVLSLAYDGAGEGLDGEILWVGTAEGMAVRRNGVWRLYRPGEEWIADIAGGDDGGEVYMGPRFEPGRRGGDAGAFPPPVTAIGVGPDCVVLGGKRSRLAVLREGRAAAFRLDGDRDVSTVIAGLDTMWIGTDGGLVWGGLQGGARGKPWPTNRPYLTYRAVLFGTRDSRDFTFRFKTLGYNTASVRDAAREREGLWVLYDAGGTEVPPRTRLHGPGTDESEGSPSTAVRLYVNVDEYVKAGDPPAYETYGRGEGIKGDPRAVYAAGRGGEVWVGTTRGLYLVHR